MMKIAVCVKQVPAYSDEVMNFKTGVMLRPSLESILKLINKIKNCGGGL